MHRPIDRVVWRAAVCRYELKKKTYLSEKTEKYCNKYKNTIMMQVFVEKVKNVYTFESTVRQISVASTCAEKKIRTNAADLRLRKSIIGN